MDWLDGLQAHWIWLTLGVLLAGLEMLVPGVYLIWLALAAIATGVMTGLLHLSLPLQVIDFVFLALIAVFSSRRWLSESPIVSADPLLNRRGARMVGQTAVVVQSIEHGSGRVHFGDSEWIAKGPDVAVGERVRITGSDGATLLVEPVGLLPDDSDGDSV
jgi:membrane protein implicated in regulation of membrane protease activity